MKLKFIVSICASLLVAVLILGILPINGEEVLYDNTVRLHVKAASDKDEDQRLKLLVRDEVLGLISEKLEGITDRDEACTILAEASDEICAASESVLRREGADDCVSVTLTDEYYPEREYDGFSLPAGNYRSLKVVIGEGEGHNWWCILFPSVCTGDALKAHDDYVEAGFTPEQYRIIEHGSGKKYRVRFKILEILSDLFGNRA